MAVTVTKQVIARGIKPQKQGLVWYQALVAITAMHSALNSACSQAQA